MNERQSSVAQPLNVRAEMSKRRARLGRAIDAIGLWLARPSLFALLVLLHLAWIVFNSGWMPEFQAWDPPPFASLSTIASVTAPFLSLLILMRQQRDGRVAETREEMLLQLVLHLDRQLARHAQQQPLEVNGLIERIARELNENEGTVGGEDEQSTGA